MKHKIKDTLTKKEVASLIKFNHPEFKLKDIQAILEAEAEIFSYGLQTGQRIKVGKLFFIEPVIRKGQKHYNGIASEKGTGKKYVQLPDRLRFKFVPLKQLKDIQDNYHVIKK
jgi:hypothetical protein